MFLNWIGEERERERGPAVCIRCKAPATLEHVLLKCRWLGDKQLAIPETLGSFLEDPAWRPAWFRAVVFFWLYGEPRTAAFDITWDFRREGCFGTVDTWP